MELCGIVAPPPLKLLLTMPRLEIWVSFIKESSSDILPLHGQGTGTDKQDPWCLDTERAWESLKWKDKNNASISYCELPLYLWKMYGHIPCKCTKGEKLWSNHPQHHTGVSSHSQSLSRVICKLHFLLFGLYYCLLSPSYPLSLFLILSLCLLISCTHAHTYLFTLSSELYYRSNDLIG